MSVAPGGGKTAPEPLLELVDELDEIAPVDEPPPVLVAIVEVEVEVAETRATRASRGAVAAHPPSVTVTQSGAIERNTFKPIKCIAWRGHKQADVSRHHPRASKRA
jgi:hypothetical protein